MLLIIGPRILYNFVDILRIKLKIAFHLLAIFTQYLNQIISTYEKTITFFYH